MRLEWTTRFRPVHIGTLLLGATAPQNDNEFIYSPAGAWYGEAKMLLDAAGLTLEGKSAEATLAEFQRRGFLLTHVLECPLGRSLKPKRLAPISKWLEQFLPALTYRELPCAMLLDREKPFALDGDAASEAAGRLRDACATQGAHATGP